MADAEIINLRAAIADRNIEIIKQLIALGQQPAPWLPAEATVELLVDLIFETDDERERFGIQVEKLIGEKLQRALDRSQTPALLTP